jgi:hypothetical protein
MNDKIDRDEVLKSPIFQEMKKNMGAEGAEEALDVNIMAVENLEDAIKQYIASMIMHIPTLLTIPDIISILISGFSFGVMSYRNWLIQGGIDVGELEKKAKAAGKLKF